MDGLLLDKKNLDMFQIQKFKMMLQAEGRTVGKAKVLSYFDKQAFLRNSRIFHFNVYLFLFRVIYTRGYHLNDCVLQHENTRSMTNLLHVYIFSDGATLLKKSCHHSLILTIIFLHSSIELRGVRNASHKEKGAF